MYDEIKKCYECVKKNEQNRKEQSILRNNPDFMSVSGKKNEQNRKEQSILRNNPDFISCKKYLKLNVWIDTVQ